MSVTKVLFHSPMKQDSNIQSNDSRDCFTIAWMDVPQQPFKWWKWLCNVHYKQSILKVEVKSNHGLPLKAHSDADLHLQFHKDPTADLHNTARPAVNKSLPKNLPNQTVILAGAKTNKNKKLWNTQRGKYHQLENRNPTCMYENPV